MAAVRKTWTVVTANVNGIRAASRRGGLRWLGEARADVLCLQEVRATHEQLHEVLAGSPLAGWHVSHVPAPQLGRAGVAVLTRDEPLAVRTSSKVPAINGLGRWIEVDCATPVGPVTVVSTYVHSGEAGTAKQDDKFAFLEGMDTRLEALRRSATRRKTGVLVCGDLNIAHRDVDLKNWRGNKGKAGCLPEERAYLDRWFGGHWQDMGRQFGGPGPGPYTWWSWRGRSFDTDGGWRIDYAMASSGLARRCVGAVVGKAPSYDERWSDHAPVTVTFA
ncbi:MAG: endonuclease/exonuclease/phosphatase family protein [Actinobacteria bacterium]|jgi:exodeoxyribonuclease-3|nr:endonuclease/exonuclease/phosphatase family protein [Actinomycetota bacterium]